MDQKKPLYHLIETGQSPTANLDEQIAGALAYVKLGGLEMAAATDDATRDAILACLEHRIRHARALYMRQAESSR